MDKYFSIVYTYLDNDINYNQYLNYDNNKQITTSIENSKFKNKIIRDKYYFVGKDITKKELDEIKNHKLNNKYNIHFIKDTLIYPYDNIITIKNYITLFIEDYYNIESIFLYYEDDNFDIDYKNIYNYYLKFNNLNILKYYNFTLNEINNILNKINININYDIFKKLFKFKNIYFPLGYYYTENNYKIPINTDIYRNINLDDLYFQDSRQSTLKKNETDIIKDYNIVNNTIYCFNFYKIHNFILHNNLIDLSSNIQKNKYINNFIIKYFYNINDYNLINNLLKKENNDILLKKYKNYFKLNVVKIDKLDYYKVSHYHNKISYRSYKDILFDKNIINIYNIFNEFILDHNIPFISYYDELNNDYIYKIDKNIFIYKIYLEDWLKNIMYNYIIKKKYISKFEGISFKVFYDYNKKVKLLSNKGRIINKNNNLYDIYIDNNKIIRKNIYLEENYELYQLIDYVEYEPIYFDVNITNNGDLNIYANLDLDEKKINKSIDNFLNKLNNTNYLLNQKYIKYNRLLFTNMISYNINSYYELPKNHNIDLDLLNKIIYCFNPIFSKNIRQYNIGDTIKYIVSPSKIISGKIKKINLDDSYEVVYDKKNIKIYSNNIIDNTNKDYMSLQFKKISNYEKTIKIYELIYKLKELNYSKDEIINIIETEFIELSKKDIYNYIEQYNLNKILIDNKFKKKNNIDVNLYIYSTNLSNDNLKYKIEYYNISSIEEYNYVHKFITSIITLYNNIKIKQNNILKDYFSDLKIQELFYNDENFDKDDNITDDTTDESDDIWDDLDDDLDMYGGTLEESEDIIETDKQIGYIKDKTIHSLLQELYKNDEDLFKWLSRNKDDNYSRICQQNRYPIVLSDDKKRYIDDKYPNSYNINKNEQSCDLLSKPTKDCNSIYYNNNWYICPKIWCVYDGISLNVNQIVKEKTIFGDKVCNGFRSNNITKDKNNKNVDDWRNCLNCGNDIKKHNIKCPQCERGVINFSNPNNKKKNFTNTESLYIVDKRKDNKLYYYPGLIDKSKHPKNLYLPCCFITSNKNILKDKIDAKKGNYVEKYKNDILTINKYGLFPDRMNKLFNNNCESNFINEIYNCYIRIGTYEETNKNNSFISTILQYIENKELKVISECSKKLNNTDKITCLKINILKNLKDSDFRNLNYGHLDIIFKGFIPNTISSFQNYLEYLISDQNIQYEYLWHLFNTNYEWLPKPFNEGVNIFILEFDEYNNENLLIPNFIYNKKFNKNIILFKNKDIFESVVYKDKKKINIFDNNNKLIVELKKLIIYNNNHYTNIKKKFKNIKYKVIDNYDKIIGIILDNNFYIPLIVSNNIEKDNIESILYKNIKEKLDYNEYIKLYNEYDNINFKIKYKIVKSNKIISLVTENKQLIPINKSNIVNDDIEITNDNILKFNSNQYYEYKWKSNNETIVLKELEKLDNKYLKYKIKSKSKNYIELNNNLIIPLNNSKIHTIKKDFESIIEDYIKLYFLSNFKINVKPVRVIMNNDKMIESIILNNGTIIPILPFNVNSIYIDKLNNKIDFKINLLNNLYYNIINYNIDSKKLIFYDKNIIYNIDKKQYENILYQKYIYEISKYINKHNNKSIILKYINHNNINGLLKNINLVTNKIFTNVDEYNDKKICSDLSNKKLCNILIDKELSKLFRIKIINDLMNNKIIRNRILNINIPKYINNDKYIFINKSDIDKNYVNNLYENAKIKFIKYPNLFKNININKINI